ncbi:MAG: hypothetical protein ACI8T1_001144 [Verrucomicrobiales bacterium]|jgi:hypothetical protein
MVDVGEEARRGRGLPSDFGAGSESQVPREKGLSSDEPRLQALEIFFQGFGIKPKASHADDDSVSNDN